MVVFFEIAGLPACDLGISACQSQIETSFLYSDEPATAAHHGSDILLQKEKSVTLTPFSWHTEMTDQKVSNALCISLEGSPFDAFKLRVPNLTREHTLQRMEVRRNLWKITSHCFQQAKYFHQLCMEFLWGTASGSAELHSLQKQLIQ
jgi:hypothetical protein